MSQYICNVLFHHLLIFTYHLTITWTILRRELQLEWGDLGLSPKFVTVNPLALSGFHFITCRIRRTTLPHLGHWEGKWDGWESILSSLKPCGHGWILLCFGLITVFFWENGGILSSSATSFFARVLQRQGWREQAILRETCSCLTAGAWELHVPGSNRSFHTGIRLHPWLLKSWLQINTENQHPLPWPNISWGPHSESSPGPTFFLTSWLAFLLLIALPLLLPDHSSYPVWAFQFSSPSWFKWFTYSHSLYLVPSTWHPGQEWNIDKEQVLWAGVKIEMCLPK